MERVTPRLNGLGTFDRVNKVTLIQCGLAPKNQVDKFTLDNVDMLPLGQHGQVQPFDKVDILTLGSVTLLTIDNVGNFPLSRYN